MAFTEDQLVLMGDGSSKLIGEVKKGDLVKTTNGAVKITEVIVEHRETFVVAVNAVNRYLSVCCTPDQVFYSDDYSKIRQPASELSKHDSVLNTRNNREWLKVTVSEPKAVATTLYSLKTENDDFYNVNGFLVGE